MVVGGGGGGGGEGRDPPPSGCLLSHSWSQGPRCASWLYAPFLSVSLCHSLASFWCVCLSSHFTYTVLTWTVFLEISRLKRNGWQALVWVGFLVTAREAHSVSRCLCVLFPPRHASPVSASHMPSTALVTTSRLD